jgi:hypothetical protein
MQPYLRFLVAALVFAGVVVVGGVSAQAQTYDAEERRFLELINAYRQDNGLRPLLLSDTISVAAERHSEDMGRYGFVAHDTARSSYYPAGARFYERMAAEGYDYNTYKAENVAAGMETAQEVFAGWRASAGHDRNMLDPNHRVIGIGRVYVPNSRYGWYWTTDFGAEVDPSARGAAEEVQDDGGVRNGDMEESTGWVERSGNGRDLIANGRARLGGYLDGRDVLRQRVRLPEEEPRFSYRLRVVGEEGHSGDLVVRLLDRRGESLATLKVYSASDAGAWITEDIGLSRYAGRTVILSYVATTGEGPAARFLLDDVEVSGGEGERRPPAERPAPEQDEELIISRD